MDRKSYNVNILIKEFEKDIIKTKAKYQKAIGVQPSYKPDKLFLKLEDQNGGSVRDTDGTLGGEVKTEEEYYSLMKHIIVVYLNIFDKVYQQEKKYERLAWLKKYMKKFNVDQINEKTSRSVVDSQKPRRSQASLLSMEDDEQWDQVQLKHQKKIANMFSFF